MTHSLDIETLCRQCVQIARDAGDRILAIYNTEFEVNEKQDKSPLTSADLAAHNFIVAQLRKLTPDIPVLSEESANISFAQRTLWHTYWLVDPLDGTREFVKRNGEFTVNIALIHEHKSILGAIHIPVLQTDYFAWQGGGSYKIENGEPAERILVRKLPEKNTRLNVATSRSHNSGETERYLKKMGDINIISAGSSLKFCLLAEGKVDLYPRLGYTAEWDTAAAHCIVEQAGGYITRTDMTPLRYNTKDSLRNPFFFAFADDSRNWSDYLDNDMIN